ncbi:MAG: hypothetical protein RL653_1758 [Pseudomonadota bacterium]|jgi:PKD repeat protein/sugar lactone lactonase YvrE
MTRAWVVVACLWTAAAGAAGTAKAVIAFDGSTGVGPVPHVEYLDGTLSEASVSGGWIVAYEWDFGDGTPKVRAGWVEHRYTQAGRFTATLTVTDSAGATGTASVVIQCGNVTTADAGSPVAPPPPGGARAIAVFDGSSGSGPVPHVEYLDGTLSEASVPGGWIVSYEWDFGDGTPRVRAGWVEHRYTQAGRFTATLTVTDSSGATGTTRLQISAGDVSSPPDAGTPVMPPPTSGAQAIAVFDGSTGSGPVPHVEYLDGTLSRASTPGGWIESYTWDFGDGTPPVNAGWVEHLYTRAGRYTATLRVRDSAGATGTTGLQISVGDVSLMPDAGTPTPDAGSAVPDAGTPPSPGSNPVSRENALPGDTGWQLQWLAGAEELSGYLSTDSAAAGERVVARVHSARALPITWMLYRVGWYGGAGGRKVAEGRFAGTGQPACPAQSGTGLVECAWAASFDFTVDAAWTSGVYLVRLLRDDGRDTHLVLTVRDARRADVVVQQSVTTWQAYNRYGGESLYDDALGLPGGHATVVSFARPYASPSPSGQLFQYELPALRWLEAWGYDVTYVTNLDFQRTPDTAQRGRVFLSVGHDEYWSLEQRTALERARDAGTWQAYLSANSAYWRVRVEAGADGPHRRMVCFKDLADPLGGAQSTVRFRDPPIGLPENGLLGAMYEAWHPVNVPLVVRSPAHWLFDGTGLRDGDALAQVVGYEADRVFDNGRTPAGTEVLAESPLTDMFGLPSWHQLTLYAAASGAHVLAAGTIEWSWALSAPGVADARLQRVTANFLGRAGAQPSTPGNLLGAANAWERADFTGSSGEVVTFAGRPGVRGAEDGATSVATFDRPSGMAVAADGTVYVVDAARHVVRRIRGGVVGTLAGGGTPGYSDGSGTVARFRNPAGLALGPDGNLYVADAGNHCVRRVTPAGAVSSFAGRCGWVGRSDGAAASALFNSPQGVAVGQDGTVYVADSYNNAVRKVAGGRVSTLAASPGGDRSVFFVPNGLSVAPDGTLLVVDSGHRAVKRVTVAGGVTELLAQYPSAGRYTLVQDWAGGGFDDGPTSRALGLPAGGAVQVGRAVYIADAGNNRIRRLDLDVQRVTTFAGTGRGRCEDGAGSAAGFSYPQGLAAQGGYLYVADGCGAVRRVKLP